jgi:hypothetical protein
MRGVCIQTCLHEVHGTEYVHGLSECVNNVLRTYIVSAYVHARYVNVNRTHARSDIRPNALHT